MKIYYIATEGWVTEEWLLNNYIRATEQRKEYDLLNTAIVEKELEVGK